MSVHNKSAQIQTVWPLLAVDDIHQSIALYRDMLGFTVAGQAQSNGTVYWCRLKRAGASIMLQQADREDGSAERRGRGVALYFICDDANALYTEFIKQGLELDPPAVAPYGMNQLFVPNADGYTICFESPTADWGG